MKMMHIFIILAILMLIGCGGRPAEPDYKLIEPSASKEVERR